MASIHYEGPYGGEQISTDDEEVLSIEHNEETRHWEVWYGTIENGERNVEDIMKVPESRVYEVMMPVENQMSGSHS